MIDSTLIRDLYRHMEWADALVWHAVPGLQDPEPDNRLHGLLYHLHFVQRAFLQVWKADAVPPYAPDQAPTLRDARAWARSYYRDLAEFLTALDGEDLGATLNVPWASMFDEQMDGSAAPTTFGDTLMQVPYHSQYHRGQVNARLRELGAEPPLVDYIAWVWLSRPAPAWLDG